MEPKDLDASSRSEPTANSPLPAYIRILIGLALAVGLLLRLKGLSYPPYDGHSFRQTQTLATIESFHKEGIDLLRPKTIGMTAGVLVLELPLFQALNAMLYDIFGPHLEIIRILNILFGIGTTWVLYRVTRDLLGRAIAILAALIYWLAPLNILYGRSMLIDPMAVLCGVVSFYTLTLLIAPSDGAEPVGGMVAWRRFAIFAAATWLTAMVKALYLWPSVLLLAQAVVTRRLRPDWRAARILAGFALAGVCFVAWNYHAAKVNDTSAFTRGDRISAHLGFSVLFEPDFYLNHIVRRPKWWLGVFGALLYPVGLWAAWTQRHERARAAALLLLILIPPTYLVCFAKMNTPHEYYGLIITPFLAITAGSGLWWCAARFLATTKYSVPVRHGMMAAAAGIFVLASAVTYLVWLKQPLVDPRKVKLEELCAGKLEAGAPAMVFVARSVSGAPTNSYIPEYVYATRLWGYGRTVEDAAGARPQFEQFAPAIPALDYVLFYGTECPDWLSRKEFRLAIQDDSHRLYVFRKIPPD